MVKRKKISRKTTKTGNTAQRKRRSLAGRKGGLASGRARRKGTKARGAAAATT